MTNKPIYLTPKELSDRWEVSENTLASWRLRKVGPCYLKIEAKIRYNLEDVEKYEKENMKSTN